MHPFPHASLVLGLALALVTAAAFNWSWIAQHTITSKLPRLTVRRPLWSLRVLFSHRRWLLRVFGAKIGKGVVVKTGVKVKFPWRLEIGDLIDVRVHRLGRALGVATAQRGNHGFVPVDRARGPGSARRCGGPPVHGIKGMLVPVRRAYAA